MLKGDGTLMEFGSVIDTISFAVDVQRAIMEDVIERSGLCPLVTHGRPAGDEVYGHQAYRNLEVSARPRVNKRLFHSIPSHRNQMDCSGLCGVRATAASAPPRNRARTTIETGTGN